MSKYVYSVFLLLLFPILLYAGDSKPVKAPKTTKKVWRKVAIEITKRCVSGVIELSTTAAAGPYQWQKDGVDIPNATLNTFKPTTAGIYKLRIDTEFSNEITINLGEPTASFTHNATNGACGSETVTFNNTSTNGDTYLWEFGGGVTSTEKNPTHTFTATPGTGTQSFNVKLTVTSSGCKTANITQTISLKQAPDARLGGTGAYTYDNKPYFRACSNNPSLFNFTNQSTTPTANSSYRIDWGDGSPVFETNSFTTTSHTYGVGIKTLTYTIIGNNGCSSTTTYTVFVGGNPAVGLGNPGNTTICTGQTLEFPVTLTENNPLGTIYTIRFNDGSDPIVLPHPLPPNFKIEHTFSKSSCGTTSYNGATAYPNAFALFIEASNPCDKSGASVVPIYVSDKPKASFNIDKGKTVCENTTVRFTSTSKGNTATSSGCTIGKLIWVVEPMLGSSTSGFTTSGNLGNDYGLTNDPGSWMTGANNIDVVFKTAGKYRVTLKVAADAGTGNCGPDIYSEEICVNPKPTASFTLPATTGCAPFTLKANNTSSTPNCGTNTYRWIITPLVGTDCDVAAAQPTYVNGTSSTSEHPEFRFDRPGRYRIVLETSSGTSCNTTSSQEITVKAPPTAAISTSIPATICAGASINPTATVKNCYGTSAVGYQWEFPGASTASSAIPNPTNITYPDAGTYRIRLKVTNECGESVWYEKSITVTPQSVGGTTSGATTYCSSTNSGTITLSGHTGSVVRWEYTINGTNWTTVSSTNTSITYANINLNRTYRAVVRSGNCTEAYSTETKIEILPPPASPTGTTSYNYCLGEPATELTVSATGTIRWYKALPTTLAVNYLATPPTPNTSTTGTVNYYATQTIGNCESAPLTITVRVNSGIANNTISSAQTICAGGAANALIGGTLSGGTGSYTYQWQKSSNGTDFEDIVNATNANYTPTSVTADTYYKRIVKSSGCLSGSNVIKITVQGQLGGLGVTASQIICYGGLPAKLIGEIPTGGNGSFTYTWERSATGLPNTFVAISGASGADYQPTSLTQTTYYQRKVTSGNCTGLSPVVSVKVSPQLILQQQADLVLCDGTPQMAINLLSNLSSNVTYVWTNNNVNIGLAASGTGTIPAFDAINTTKQPLIATISYKAIYKDADDVPCETPMKEFKIVVLPTINLTTTLSDKSYCNGVATTAISLASDADTYAAATVSYRWTSSPTIGLANGTGAQLPSFTTANNTNAPIISTVTVTPLFHYQGKTCEGTPKSFQITVNPAPSVIFSAANQTICSNAASSAINLSSNTTNISISWTAANVPGITGIVNSGTNEIPAQILINTTNAPITIIYKAKATTTDATACEGVETEYRITVNPVPAVTANATTKTICSGERVNVSLSSNVADTQFLWVVAPNTNVTGAANGSGALINQALVNTSTIPQIVSYIVTPTFGNAGTTCSGSSVEIKVTVNPSPVVTFSASNLEICSGQSTSAVNLNSTTTNANISWTVNVPTGINGVTALTGTTIIPIETLINTTNSPLTVIYRATAKTDDANACAGTVAEYKILVNPQARLTNTVLTQQVCSGALSKAVVLQSNVNTASFSWTATASSAEVTGFVASGSGNIPAQNFVNTGTAVHKVIYQIVIAANGCGGTTATYEIDVYPSPIFTSNRQKIELCSRKLFAYTPTSSTTGVLFSWTRAAVTGISNAAASGSGIDAAATINETLINTTINPIDVTYEFTMTVNGCSTGVKIPIVVTINPPTTAKFGLSAVNGCAPFNLVIKNLNSRALVSTYTVNFGDGSPNEVYNDTRDITHTYSNDTKQVKLFYITITTKNECGEQISTPFEIRVQPQTVFSKLVLNATQSFGCAPYLIDFTTANQSTGANLFTWDFGDGSAIQQTTAVNEKITHVFANPGTYTVTLTATNGCSTVKTTETLTVFPQVVTNFSIDKPQTCIGTELIFTNQSDAAFTAYWDFGDGTTSTDLNPKHRYTTSGIKTITLRSTRSYPNGGTCTTIAVKTVNILAAPVATFSSNASALNCSPFNLAVNANSSEVTNIEWDFGDVNSTSNTAIGLSANHTYLKAGDYVITAKAYNAQGCVSTSTQIVRITESAIASFSTSLDNICGTSGKVNFKNESSYAGNTSVVYKWFVNGNQVASSKDLSYDFAVPTGASLPYKFNVKLEASNLAGCRTVAEKEINFNPFPKSDFVVVQSKGCAPFKVAVQNNSVHSDSYQWFIDNILVSTDRVPQNLILTEFNKTYILKLVTRNKYGCQLSEQTLPVSTYPYLKAQFSAAQNLSCNGLLNLAIVNNSVGATSYTWDYGDGSPVYVGNNPQHSYGVAGEYNLKLTVSNGFCTDEQVEKIIVSNAPKASFLANVKNGCNQLTVTFQNTSVNATDYHWDFGDGTFSKEQNPTHNYVYSKTAYTVTLTVKNRYGCEDKMTQTNLINVYPPPEVLIAITPDKIIKVPDYSFTFKAITNEDIISYRWDFGDGKTSDRKEIIHKYDRFGTYKVKLHVTNRSNCTNVIEDEVTIIDFPGYLFIPNAFEPENLNNDLKVFKVKGGGLATFSLKIFNKWGKLIWETNKLDADGVPLEYWDGKFGGALQAQGAYYWQAEATFINGGVWKGMKYENKSETKMGVVHLIR